MEYNYGKIKPRYRKNHVGAFWKRQCNCFSNYKRMIFLMYEM